MHDLKSLQSRKRRAQENLFNDLNNQSQDLRSDILDVKETAEREIARIKREEERKTKELESELNLVAEKLKAIKDKSNVLVEKITGYGLIYKQITSMPPQMPETKYLIGDIELTNHKKYYVDMESLTKYIPVDEFDVQGRTFLICKQEKLCKNAKEGNE